jgi:hypothetical protein
MTVSDKNLITKSLKNSSSVRTLSHNNVVIALPVAEACVPAEPQLPPPLDSSPLPGCRLHIWSQ